MIGCDHRSPSLFPLLLPVAIAPHALSSTIKLILTCPGTCPGTHLPDNDILVPVLASNGCEVKLIVALSKTSKKTAALIPVQWQDLVPSASDTIWQLHPAGCVRFPASEQSCRHSSCYFHYGYMQPERNIQRKSDQRSDEIWSEQ